MATGTVSVASGTSVTSIVHNLSNSGFITALAPNWNTTTWVGTRSGSAASIHFGTQVPSGGGQLDWRAET